MSLNTKLSKLVSSLKISIQNRNLVVKYKKNHLLVNILECFLKEGLISGFFEQQNHIFVILKYNNLGECVIKDLVIKYKRPFEVHWRNKDLKSNSFYKNYVVSEGDKTSFYLLSTSQGLMTHLDAIKLGIGGKVLLLVKF